MTGAGPTDATATGTAEAVRRVLVYPDATTLEAAAAARLALAMSDRLAVAQRVDVALTGGGTGVAVLRALAESPLRAIVDWSGVHLWWGDERFVPAQDADRNDLQAREVLLGGLVDAGALPEANIHPMPARADGARTEGAGTGAGAPAVAADPDAAAAAYAADLTRELGPDPTLDIVLLGLGPDAHVASLFPGHPALGARSIAVGVRDSPKPPPERVSLTFSTIGRASEVWIVTAGESKESAVARSLSGAPAREVPAAGAQGRRRTLWLLDAQAAAEAESRAEPPERR